MQFDVRIRLTPTGAISGPTRPFAEGIVQSMSLRGAEGDRELSVDEVEDATWESAWAQTRMLERPQEINAIDASGVPLLHLFSDSKYGASCVPFLCDLIDVGPQGALVSMPLMGSVLAHPISHVSLVQAAQALIPVTRQVHRSGPGSLSSNVYWWLGGRLTWIPTYFGRNGIDFHAPNGLADLIAGQQ